MINSGEKEEFFFLFVKDIKSGDVKSVNIRFDILERKENFEWLKEYLFYNSKSEILFYLVVKKFDDIFFIRKFVELCF